jgi:hypothetical protein
MKKLIVLVFSLVFLVSLAAQDHGHLNIGASGGVLTFDNGADFSGDYIKTLVSSNSGKFANTYNANITLTALHSMTLGEIDPAAPKPGAFVVAEIVSVSGPAGGEFGFWETNSTTAPAASIPAGATNASFRFDISEAALGAGQPAGDAFGHIHGRRFSATVPGVYTVGFRAYDTSTNGPDGGPIHGMSGLQEIRFQAGVNIIDLHTTADQVTATIGAMAGYAWQLQGADSLMDPEWQPIGDPVAGNDSLQEIEAPLAPANFHFFRLLGTPIEP